MEVNVFSPYTFMIGISTFTLFKTYCLEFDLALHLYYPKMMDSPNKNQYAFLCELVAMVIKIHIFSYTFRK